MAGVVLASPAVVFEGNTTPLKTTAGEAKVVHIRTELFTQFAQGSGPYCFVVQEKTVFQ